MVTNLRKGKKIRAFCYRMIAVGAVVATISSAFMGREALTSGYEQEMSTTALKGEMYYLTEFREYISRLYDNAMIGYAGIGDDKGYPLTDAYGDAYSRQARAEFEATVEELGEDILYYIKDAKGREYSNISYPLFSEYDGHLLVPDNVRLCYYWDGPAAMMEFFSCKFQLEEGVDTSNQYYVNRYKPNKEEAAQMQVVIAVKRNCTSKVLSRMESKAFFFSYILRLCGVFAAIWIVFGMLSLFGWKAVRQAKEDYARVSVKVWFECKLLLAAGVAYVVYSNGLHCFGEYLVVRMPLYDTLWMYFPIGCLFYLFYVDFRINKVAVLLNSRIIKCFCCMREFVHGKLWYQVTQVLNIATLIGGLMLVGSGWYLATVDNVRFFARKILVELHALGIVLIVAGVLLLVCFIWQRKFTKDLIPVIHKLSEMRNGRGKEPLYLSKYSSLAFAAQDLNELENGIEKAVEEQSRSNKMRVELITNVSHDLKTPLTSIINYADLLCEEELPETAAEYATALQTKAYRLKNMVQDVFDLSKATSGNLTVEKNVIDLVKLIKQTLADMDERIQDSTLIFKLNISKEPLLIEADGEKLYRVFQNLFVNALQYSLENSRVHVQLAEENGFAVAKVKNTSRMELDFEPDEIVERFVRADSSRTTEGSGLGLSIVQSFTEACGGQFMIETDADMFTACVRFPISQKPIIVEPIEEGEEDSQNELE